ncbi:Major intracellular serine protease precursor, putative [Perkinsus marinus ATCC 50983]|uniref:subtilisin n=1 Tax=Perkinsus marinus (strain ATCC 50983 / TXsc) TaxID=423536 RepID=C5KFX6_PERM5|nr:Major intracellular serine protease precursor, putative [Perkinsus marinus ATCC 50983]EER16624.1 Major intracellular serine protease precursor, putative [Perkinsus marinus ATCC 50983]|eukprot:XP_002784828.1 Major intracellular serine protease precursor, putative [Perkinsus marinus ATCC 50983]
MMAQALAASDGTVQSLSQDDLDCERCFAQDDMVYDLKALGVQIIDSSCPAGQNQILNYLRKAEHMLSIDFDCDPDSTVSLHPTFTTDRTSCTGGNPALGTNDPGSSCQRNLEVINLGAAFEAVRSAGRELKDVVLAIIDTGVDMTHPDLVTQFWRNHHNNIGYNFLFNNTNVTDDHGHGTHCAGIAAAQTNNCIGIAGVTNIDGSAPKVKLMILKFINASGIGYQSDSLRALDFAIEKGAAFSSHSYRWPNRSEIFETAYKNAAAAGHLAFFGAGNEEVNLDDAPVYPCSYAEETSMVCVAASTSDPTKTIWLASFSNAGSVTKVAAPGSAIYSTMPDGQYDFMTGTSMSTPTVAGVAALLGTLGLDSQKIVDTIMKSRTEDLQNKFGLSDIGLINAYKAVQIALSSPATRY